MLTNINPKLWKVWTFLHYLTIAYPENPTPMDKNNIKQFFLALGPVLPCENCRQHFALNLQLFPLTDNVLSCRYNLINWLRNIHNEINVRTGKKTFSYDDVIKEYPITNNKNYIVEILTIVLLLILIVVICIYIYSKKILD